jgi:hypothetical protein
MGGAGARVGRDVKRARVGRAARRGNRHLKKAAANPWLERAVRAGYVVRGLIYGVMGVLAIDLALGGSATTTDQRGGVVLLATHPLTTLFLVAVILALAAYSLWGFIRAIYDPLGRGEEPAGLAARIGFAGSGLNYAALLVFAAGVLLGSGGSDSDPVQQLVRWALYRPAGAFIVLVSGGIAVVAGIGQFVEAYKAGFEKDLKRTRMSRAQRLAVDSLGRFGMVARGVIFMVVGVFIVEAGLHRDAADAHGFGPAFQAIAREPLGHALLAIVALGFIALALHSLANARWIRLPRGPAGR